MRKLTAEEFIAKAKEVHGGKYDYSKAHYINSRTKIIIICPIHGKFVQISANHLTGQGCSVCTGNEKSTSEKFIEKSVKIHGNKYDYSKVNYANNITKIIIVCQEHGEFEQMPKSHLKGHGCLQCAGKEQSTTEEFISKARMVHNTKYDYSKVNYINAHTKISIICPIHGIFEQKPYSHLDGSECPSCAITGFDINKSAYLYYLMITTDTNQVLYKIGITNRTVDERFSLLELTKIKIVKQKLYDIGQEAYDWEQKLLKLYKQYQYKGPKILNSGNTELFTEDIIALYYKENNL